MRINVAAIPLTESSTSNLTFSNGVADYTVNYPDAGQMQLHFKFDQDPYDGVPFNAMLHDSNLFTVVPAGLRIFSDDADADCVSGDGSCTKFKKAGEIFNLKINAYCESGNPAGAVTPNFQLNNIDLSHSLISPSGGTSGAPRGSGSAPLHHRTLSGFCRPSVHTKYRYRFVRSHRC